MFPEFLYHPHLSLSDSESSDEDVGQANNKKTRIILHLTRITSFHVYVLERYDIRMIRAIPALRVTSNQAYVISL